MKQKEYRFIFFLNIRHSFYSEGELGRKHSHTWELEVTMHPRGNTLVKFRDVEQVALSYLERFQDKYLNTIMPFHRMNPSIENFLDNIIDELNVRMVENEWDMLQVKISENPTRSYMIDLRDGERIPAAMPELLEAELQSAAAREPELAEEVQKTAAREPEPVQRKETVTPVEAEQRKEATKQVVTEQKVTAERKPEQTATVQQSAASDDVCVRMQQAQGMTRIVITIP